MPDRDRASEPGPSHTLWWYATVLVRRRRVMIAVPVILATLTVARSLTAARHYDATASFISAERGAAQGGLGQIAGQLNVGFGIMWFFAISSLVNSVRGSWALRGFRKTATSAA